MIEVTVTENGQQVATLRFDDENLYHHVGAAGVVFRDVMAAVVGAPLWQRVAHAATMAALSESGFDDLMG